MGSEMCIRDSSNTQTNAYFVNNCDNASVSESILCFPSNVGLVVVKVVFVGR